MRLDPAPADEGPNERESAPTTECGKAMHQTPVKAEFALESRGEAPRVERSGEAGRAGVETDTQANAAATQRYDLNLSNRRMRTRMSGGVGGDRRG
jgi:hypothetical protein